MSCCICAILYKITAQQAQLHIHTYMSADKQTLIICEMLSTVNVCRCSDSAAFKKHLNCITFHNDIILFVIKIGQMPGDVS